MAVSQSQSQSCASSQDSSVDRSTLRVVILEAKNIYRYTIPSFCAITMNLQHVTLECSNVQDEESFEGYIRIEGDTHGINQCLPACVRIVSACIVPVSSSTCVYIIDAAYIAARLFHT